MTQPPHRAGFRRWTPEEDAVLRQMWAAGAGIRAIAACLGRTRMSIQKRRHQLALPRHAAAGSPRSREQDARIADLAAAGNSSRQIADLIGTTRNAVIGHCRRRGIKLKGGAKPPPGGGWEHQQREQKAAARPKKTGKNNNPTGFTARHLVADRRSEPDGLPVMPPCTPRVAIVDLAPHHCRYIGDRPELITMDTPIYCGGRTAEGSSWCEEHSALVFNRGARPFRVPPVYLAR